MISKSEREEEEAYAGAADENPGSLTKADSREHSSHKVDGQHVQATQILSNDMELEIREAL